MSGAVQSFTSEADVGYLYVYARYANCDVHVLDDAELNVTVLAPDTLAYTTTSGGRHQLSIVTDALAATCYDALLSVQLLACDGSLPAVSPPLELDLPSPVALRAIGLSATVLAPTGSFARSGALSSRPPTTGVPSTDTRRSPSLSDSSPPPPAA